MAEAGIVHLLANLTPFVKDEYKLLSAVREEIEYIGREFERMTAFLKDYEANGEQPQELKLCVRQIREAAYKAGDVLEHFTHHLNRHNGNGFLHKVYFYVRTLKVRHQVGTKLRKIKNSLDDILAYKREINYNNMLGMIVHGLGPQNVHNDPRDGQGGGLLSINNERIVGFEGPESEIMDWFKNNDNRLQLFSIVAMGGIGKTTLVKMVFNNDETKKIFDSHAWITVSKTCMVTKLLKDVIEQLYKGISKKVSEEVEKIDDINILKAEISEFLMSRRYLLVVDDVWERSAWDYLKYAFPDNGCGSRILLTTRIEKVASGACEGDYGKVYRLLRLSDEMAWTLFCLKAFKGQDCPAHLQEISREILKKCEGLPLAIVVIGSLLSTKDLGGIDEWGKFNRTLGTMLEGNGELQNVQKVLLLSYINLPSNLKNCFLYLSIYPKNNLIDHWRLVRLLIAEGFIVPKQGMTIEEAAIDSLLELVNRNLILVEKLSTNGMVKTYHIHEMFREIITSKSMEVNLVTIADKQVENNWPNKVRRLSTHDGFTRWHEIKHIIRKLRSLHIFSSTDEGSTLLLLKSLRDGASMLKVLDFRGFPLIALPDKTLKLPYLKYLCLRGNKIKEIPKSIGNLLWLETLDLKDTLVTVLPDEITKLSCLRHLLVYRYIQEIFYLPFHDQIGFRSIKEIGNLKYLQKLCSIELNEVIPNGEIITEIGKLTQLRRINILKVKNEDGEVLCGSLKKLKELRSLSIGLINEDEIINLDALSPPPQYLQTLGVKGRLENFPCWISSFQSVSKLKLRYSKLKDDPLMSLQGLPNLTELLLEKAYIGESLSFKSGGFPRLKKLVLDRLNTLTMVEVIKGAMPQLEMLHIFGCDSLKKLPSGIEFLLCLRDLQLIDLSYEFISSLHKDIPEGDHNKISHVLKVNAGQYKDGQWRQHHF